MKKAIFSEAFSGRFKENFKQSTLIWLIIAAFSVVWWVDFRIAGMMGAGVGEVLRIIFLIVAFCSCLSQYTYFR